MNREFWADKRVLLTGHTGFKGSWLKLWLQTMGAEVIGLALPMDTEYALHDLLFGETMPQDEHCDIRDAAAVNARVLKARPEIVFHLAAQPLVRASYRDPAETWATNVQGTLHVLEALRIVPEVKSIVVITTDKVYENHETGRAFVETDPLGGHDPYSASKAAAEIVSASHRLSFFQGRHIGLATARAGNVIGGGDWAQDRLIPDAVRAWSGGDVLTVRNPYAVRPWQHVLEPLGGYMSLAQKLFDDPKHGSAWNFGPDHTSAASVGHVLELARAAYGSGDLSFGTPNEGPHEAGYLMLDSSKAAQNLDFMPRWDLNETVSRTMNWYCNLSQGQSAEDLCMADLIAYTGQARSEFAVAS